MRETTTYVKELSEVRDGFHERKEESGIGRVHCLWRFKGLVVEGRRGEFFTHL